MFSETSSSPLLRACAAIAALAVLAGCGLKGDPQPPLRTVPLKTQDLELRQQGRWILLEMGYPKTTMSGMALGGIDAVELLQAVRPVQADGGSRPPPRRC